jgi:hypothetical protein
MQLSVDWLICDSLCDASLAPLLPAACMCHGRDTPWLAGLLLTTLCSAALGLIKLASEQQQRLLDKLRQQHAPE